MNGQSIFRLSIPWILAWVLPGVMSILDSTPVAAAEPPHADPLSIPHGATSIGVKECAACHSAPSPIYKALGVTRFVRLIEAQEWLDRDKHAYAYQLVRQDLSPDELKKEERKSNRLSIEITSKLEWIARDGENKGDGNFERKCLTCHVGKSATEHSATVDANLAVQFGVQCESCHGPGSEYTKLEHHQQVSWRTKTPEQKSELGMWDLSSPSTAAKVCLSCHLGNIDQSRFVTHEMYAAGHPVLPPFDLQVFLNAMPPHWQTLKEKSSFEERPKYIEAHYDIAGNTDEIQSAIKSSYDKTRRSMIGGLVANDLGIELIHQGAADAKTWGDYSIYNCMGCHQELKKNSTQVRRESRTPGRPFPANWLTLDYPKMHTTSFDSHTALTREMLASFNTVPFGDVRRLTQLSENHLQSLADRFQDRRKMEKQVMSKKDVHEWLAFLNTSRQAALTDYWVAKQTAWMVCVAIDELVEHGELAIDVVSLNRNELRQLLRLDLQLPQRQSVLIAQKDALQTAQKFDSARCKELLGQLINTAISP
jgi:hypothetical protein